jgi:tRNA pseudouridine38-40 synthase
MGQSVHVHGTSRTDAGVHAYGQCASFSGNFGIPVERIPVAVNNLLEDAAVVSAREVSNGFHARYSAVGKTYLYRICVSDRSDIFLREYRYQLNGVPDTGKMKKALRQFVGTHDFNAFRSVGGKEPETTVRTIRSAELEERESVDSKGFATREIEIRVTGDGFLYNMVRIIVGTLVDVGRGRIADVDVGEIIASGDRTMAGHTAPPQGLWLERVYFD